MESNLVWNLLGAAITLVAKFMLMLLKILEPRQYSCCSALGCVLFLHLYVMPLDRNCRSGTEEDFANFMAVQTAFAASLVVLSMVAPHSLAGAVLSLASLALSACLS